MTPSWCRWDFYLCRPPRPQSLGNVLFVAFGAVVPHLVDHLSQIPEPHFLHPESRASSVSGQCCGSLHTPHRSVSPETTHCVNSLSDLAYWFHRRHLLTIEVIHATCLHNDECSALKYLSYNLIWIQWSNFRTYFCSFHKIRRKTRETNVDHCFVAFLC